MKIVPVFFGIIFLICVGLIAYFAVGSNSTTTKTDDKAAVNSTTSTNTTQINKLPNTSTVKSKQ